MGAARPFPDQPEPTSSSPDGFRELRRGHRPTDQAGRRRRQALLDHAAVPLGYLLLAVGLSWPLLRDFRTHLVGAFDARQFVWMLWHTREALLGREPFFETSLLYYPHGAALISNSIGPVSGILAAPFFPLGAEAAYNASLLLAFSLSGWAMYALARHVGFERAVAFFAGVVFVAAPIHLTAFTGHFHKALTAPLPLVVLATLLALDVRRSRAWVLAPGGALLLALLQAGDQFVFGGVAIAILAVAAVVAEHRADRAELLARAAASVIGALLACAPVLVLVFRLLHDPAIVAEKALDAPSFQPDVLQFFVAPWFSRWFGRVSAALLQRATGATPDAVVSIPLAAILLCLIALAARARQAARWIALALGFAALALGPWLTIFGRSRFTRFELPIVMPFAFLTSIPGASLIRATDRFMLMGFVGIALWAGVGLTWLCRRSPRHARGALVAAATALVLLEVWPTPWIEEALPPVPQFYRQIAGDPETYGVFDLPIRPSEEISYLASYALQSSHYQLFQMTHRKGIASGHLTRGFLRHPLFAQFVSNSINPTPLQKDLQVNGRPADRYANARFELARLGYRYVVFHKTDPPTPEGLGHAPRPGTWGRNAALGFLADVFGDEKPIVDDDLVRVYAVGSPPEVSSLATAIALRESPDDNWSELRRGRRWISGSASFYVASPIDQDATLEITPAEIHDPAAQADISEAAVTLESPSAPPATARIRPHATSVLPLHLAPGSQTIRIRVLPSLPRPTTPPYSQLALEFGLGTINLHTPPAAAPPEESLRTRSARPSEASAGVAPFGFAEWGEGREPLVATTPRSALPNGTRGASPSLR